MSQFSGIIKSCFEIILSQNISFISLLLALRINLKKFVIKFLKKCHHIKFHLKIILRALSSQSLFKSSFSKLYSGFHFWTFLKMSIFQNPLDFFFHFYKSLEFQNDLLQCFIFQNYYLKTTPYMQWRFLATFMFHFVTFCYKIILS